LIFTGENMKIDIKKVGKIIGSIRRIRGITQKQIARETGLTINYLSLLENGKRGIALGSLDKICEIINIPPAAIFILATRRNKKFPVISRLKKIVRDNEAFHK